MGGIPYEPVCRYVNNLHYTMWRAPTKRKNHTTRDVDRKSAHSQCVYFEGTSPCEGSCEGNHVFSVCNWRPYNALQTRELCWHLA